jgi:inorganic phosphate transporter, PiT family
MDNHLLLFAVILAALWYDFVNGFHDAANAIATVVTTHALSSRQAIYLARTLNVLGALAHTAVAYTIGKGVISSHVITLPILLGALLGAIAWGYFTWYHGLPSSSTHALIGGLVGVALVANNFNFQILVLSSIKKILLVMIISPIVGFLLGLILMTFFSWITWKSSYQRSQKFFKKFQILSASFVSFTHGMNDAQNGMGVITIALVTAGSLQSFQVPMWVRLASALAIGAGTSIGGWRIIKTMGEKITNLKPIDGCAAETASGATILTTALLGIPVSTTHNINGAIIGTGAARNLDALNWWKIKNIVIAWLLTFPGAALCGMLSYFGGKTILWFLTAIKISF